MVKSFDGFFFRVFVAEAVLASAFLTLATGYPLSFSISAMAPAGARILPSWIT